MLPSPCPESTVLFLIRHGATECNLARPPRLQGRGVNLGLSSAGKVQAERTAGYLQRLRFDVIYSSPLLRAWETADTIARPHELPLTTAGQLIEVDVGQWEGCSWEEIASRDAEHYARFLELPCTYGYLGGENMTQVAERVVPVFSQLLRENLGRRIAVVSHSVAIRAYLASVLGLPLARCRHLPQDNCCINVLSYRDEQTLVHVMNGVFHLDGIENSTAQ